MRRARFVILNFAILASLALAAVDSTAAEGTPAFEKRLEEMRARVVERIQALIVGTLAHEPPASTDISTQPAPDPFRSNGPEVTALRSYFRNSSRLGFAVRRLASYESGVRRILCEEPVPAELACLPVVESLYHPQGVSPAGGRGLWQIMAETGSCDGLRQTGEFDEREHVEKSTRAAARYLRDVYRLFGDWRLALATYNAGENRIQRLLVDTGSTNFGELALEDVLPLETCNYVPAVLAVSRCYGTSPWLWKYNEANDRISSIADGPGARLLWAIVLVRCEA
jgi:Transglycosylase SLT domain